MITVQEFTLGPFAQHPLIVSDDVSQEAILIDIGFDDGTIIQFMEQHAFVYKGIFNTHAHIDHVGATAILQKKFTLPFYLGKGERVVLDYAPTSAAQYGFPFSGFPVITEEICSSFSLQLGKFLFEIIETPGHTPGGLCFYCAQAKLLLAGDTLFAGSIGRTDLPGGDYPTILQSLEKLKRLPRDTIVHCGHGPQTTIGQELDNNPFLHS